jgi:hypothetical protein
MIVVWKIATRFGSFLSASSLHEMEKHKERELASLLSSSASAIEHSLIIVSLALHMENGGREDGTRYRAHPRHGNPSARPRWKFEGL